MYACMHALGFFFYISCINVAKTFIYSYFVHNSFLKNIILEKNVKNCRETYTNVKTIVQRRSTQLSYRRRARRKFSGVYVYARTYIRICMYTRLYACMHMYRVFVTIVVIVMNMGKMHSLEKDQHSLSCKSCCISIRIVHACIHVHIHIRECINYQKKCAENNSQNVHSTVLGVNCSLRQGW